MLKYRLSVLVDLWFMCDVWDMKLMRYNEDLDGIVWIENILFLRNKGKFFILRVREV